VAEMNEVVYDDMINWTTCIVLSEDFFQWSQQRKDEWVHWVSAITWCSYITRVMDLCGCLDSELL